jgi:hypothetical protein
LSKSGGRFAHPYRGIEKASTKKLPGFDPNVIVMSSPGLVVSSAAFLEDSFFDDARFAVSFLKDSRNNDSEMGVTETPRHRSIPLSLLNFAPKERKSWPRMS